MADILMFKKHTEFKLITIPVRTPGEKGLLKSLQIFAFNIAQASYYTISNSLLGLAVTILHQ